MGRRRDDDGLFGALFELLGEGIRAARDARPLVACAIGAGFIVVLGLLIPAKFSAVGANNQNAASCNAVSAILHFLGGLVALVGFFGGGTCFILGAITAIRGPRHG